VSRECLDEGIAAQTNVQVRSLDWYDATQTEKGKQRNFAEDTQNCLKSRRRECKCRARASRSAQVLLSVSILSRSIPSRIMLRCHGCRKWPAIMLTVGRQRRRVEHWHVRYMQYSRARLINNSPLQTHGTFPSAILLCTCCHLGRCTSLVHDGVPCGIPLRTWLRQAMCICLHLGVGPCGIDRRRLSV